MTLVNAPCAVRRAIRYPYHSWSYELNGSLKVDPLVCPKYAGQMRVVAFIEDMDVIRKILKQQPAYTNA